MYPKPVLCSSFLRLLAQISHITFPVCRLQQHFKDSTFPSTKSCTSISLRSQTASHEAAAKRKRTYHDYWLSYTGSIATAFGTDTAKRFPNTNAE
jgi:hypothetical protein